MGARAVSRKTPIYFILFLRNQILCWLSWTKHLTLDLSDLCSKVSILEIVSVPWYMLYGIYGGQLVTALVFPQEDLTINWNQVNLSTCLDMCARPNIRTLLFLCPVFIWSRWMKYLFFENFIYGHLIFTTGINQSKSSRYIEYRTGI